MAFVVAVAQQKGGSGKSTVAANLAAVLAAEGRRVALLDTDPQGSVTRWHQERQRHSGRAAPLFFDHPSGWRVPTALDRLRRAHDIVVLDTPPHAGTDAKVAIRAADLVLMPLQPSPPDLWASEATLRLAADERRPLRALLNRVPAQGKMRDKVQASLAELGISVLEQSLGNRAHFASSFLEGLSVTEAAPRSAAAAEMRAVALAVAALSSSGRR